MDSVSSATVTNASSADPGSVQGAASVAVLRKSLDQQASLAAELVAGLPQPALATGGSVGTKLNTYA